MWPALKFFKIQNDRTIFAGALELIGQQKQKYEV